MQEYGELEYLDGEKDWVSVTSATNFARDIVPAKKLRYVEIVPMEKPIDEKIGQGSKNKK